MNPSSMGGQCLGAHPWQRADARGCLSDPRGQRAALLLLLPTVRHDRDHLRQLAVRIVGTQYRDAVRAGARRRFCCRLALATKATHHHRHAPFAWVARLVPAGDNAHPARSRTSRRSCRKMQGSSAQPTWELGMLPEADWDDRSIDGIGIAGMGLPDAIGMMFSAGSSMKGWAAACCVPVHMSSSASIGGGATSGGATPGGATPGGATPSGSSIRCSAADWRRERAS